MKCKSKPATRTEKNPRISFAVLFWLFFFGSILGFILEGLWHVINSGHWENHSSSILGPFCFIYGIAAVLLYAATNLLGPQKAFVFFVVFAVLGSALEFVFSLLQEVIFGSTSWNYSKHFLNIGGRVSLKMTAIWGALGVVFAKWLYPLFNLASARMQGGVWNFICAVTAVFMLFNILVTSIAVLRWGERVTVGDAPSNAVESFFDENYGNDQMKAMFTNLSFAGEEKVDPSDLGS